MPEQQTLFEHQTDGRCIAVLKTYDPTFAREVFARMDEKALQFLGRALNLESKFDASDIPSPADPGYPEVLWEEIEEGAREDWNAFSYFIVTEQSGTERVPIFVSSEWPMAEAFAKERIECDTR